MRVTTPVVHHTVDTVVDEILRRIGKDIRLGLSLGLGKPVELVNALYRRACADPSIKLTILSALSLEKPSGASPLERAFLQPFVDRVFAGVPDLEYVRAQRDGSLPANVEVCEFFFRPGSMLGNARAQQNYISTNYTFAARDVFDRGCNVVTQIVCKRVVDGRTFFSLSCNPDTSLELAQRLEESGRPYLAIAEINQNLPYMANDAEVPDTLFDLVIDDPSCTTPLFSTPKMPVTTPDVMIGLAASALVRDGGTLQIGIGSLGDAIVDALKLRDADTASYRDALAASGVARDSAELIEAIGGTGPFEQGLYGATEMFVDGFWHLLRAGILRRRVYDFWALQQLINDGRCKPEALDPVVLEHMESLGVRVIRTQDFECLQHHGFFTDDTRYQHGYIVAPDGERAVANVADPTARALMARCMGTALRRGIVLHGGFFLGPRAFYDGLNAMTQAERDAICMTGVNKINQLDVNPRLYQHQRRDARFINTGMMAMLSGAVVSDGLDDLRVVSGVGGQYNFVAMAHQLRDGRSILLVRAVRDTNGDSNIVFNYGHTTIPRHLRDIVITEYGIAQLRGRSDSEVAKALINIADSRHQPSLLARAQQAGKIERGYQVPERHRNNTPERLEAALAPFRARGLFPAFPLGCDFTDEELMLAKALKAVKARAESTPKWKLLLTHLLHGRREAPTEMRHHLRRLNLEAPKTLQDGIARTLLLQALAGTA
ncbi:acetyl-CoA hydrolase [Sinimarinibacterium sp. CAU 1509]|nr:acetyl-CoA hydrolase [Sinimarinibacterium sp. CAU 1509]